MLRLTMHFCACATYPFRIGGTDVIKALQGSGGCIGWRPTSCVVVCWTLIVTLISHQSLCSISDSADTFVICQILVHLFTLCGCWARLDEAIQWTNYGFVQRYREICPAFDFSWCMSPTWLGFNRTGFSLFRYALRYGSTAVNLLTSCSL